MADLINHQSQSQTSFQIDPAGQLFVMKNEGRTTFRKGKEIFLDYGGDHSIFSTFMRYGMVQEDDPLGYLPIHVGDSQFEMTLRVSGPKVMWFFRSLIEEHEGVEPGARQRATDLRSMQLCTHLLRQYLLEKPSRLSSDMAEYKALTGFSRTKLVMLYRIELKKILHRNYAFCDRLQMRLLCLGPALDERSLRYSKVLFDAETFANSAFHEDISVLDVTER